MILCHSCGRAGYECTRDVVMEVCVRCDLLYDFLNTREW
jgi:hypothetical protein